MNSATSTCPAALSFIFKPHLPEKKTEQNSPQYYKNFGSTGVGCTVSENVAVSVSLSLSGNNLFFNGKKNNLPTVFAGLKKLTDRKLKILITSKLPLGYGFGVSGASTFAALLAANKLLNTNKTYEELAIIAHYAEIAERTGLGTIATQMTGGFLIKKKSGIPPVFNKLNFTGRKIYATVIKSLATSQILADKKILAKISFESERALGKIENDNEISLTKILKISNNFCLLCGLLKSGKTKKIIESIRKRGGEATMAILGNTVLSTLKPKNTKYPVFQLTISSSPAETR